MGIHSLYFNCFIMKLFFFLPLLLGALAHKDEHCKKVKRVVKEDVCDPYVEKKCYTEVQQKCKKILFPHCKADVQDIVLPKCIVVEDVVCDLVEKVGMKEVPETVVVQKCHQENNKVCDIVNGLTTVKDHGKDCLNVKKVKCWKEKKVVKEQKCFFSWKFDCPKHSDKYSHKKCHKTPVKNCKDFPKVMLEKKCKTVVEKDCRKLKFTHASPVRNQKCHAVPVKKCILKTLIKPKQVQVFSYEQVCKSVPRKLCDKVLKQKLQPVCKQVESTECVYKPKKKCKEEKQKHCYKKEKIVYDNE